MMSKSAAAIVLEWLDKVDAGIVEPEDYGMSQAEVAALRAEAAGS